MLLYALISSGGPHASVLCIGADGHIGIESRCGEPGCCEVEATAGPAVIRADERSCCECRDVPLTREGRPMVVGPKAPGQMHRSEPCLSDTAAAPFAQTLLTAAIVSPWLDATRTSVDPHHVLRI
jgi:hypothetical protein